MTATKTRARRRTRTRSQGRESERRGLPQLPGATATPASCRRWRKDADRTPQDRAGSPDRGCSDLRPGAGGGGDRGRRRPRRQTLGPGRAGTLRDRPAAPVTGGAPPGRDGRRGRHLHQARATGGPARARQGAAGEEDQPLRLSRLGPAVPHRAPHPAAPPRRAARAARLRGQLRGATRARRAPDRLADAGGVPSDGAQPPVLAQAALSGDG